MKYRAKLAFAAVFAGALALPFAAFAQVPRAQQVANFNNYLGTHPKTAAELSKHPALVNNAGWLANHPGLQKFLANHPHVRRQLHHHPQVFLNAEGRYPNSYPLRGRGYGIPAAPGGFLGAHPGIAEDLRHDPGLVNNAQYMRRHAEFAQFLRTHPNARAHFRAERHHHRWERRHDHERHDHEGHDHD